MEKESEIVAKKIESGEYYADALNWFHSQFTKSRAQYSFLLIVTTIALAALVMAIATMVAIFPLSPNQRFVVPMEISPINHIRMKPIAVAGENADAAYIKFMLGEYVKSREEYSEQNIERNFRFVTEMTADDVYEDYLFQTSLENEQNPIILYGQNASIDIAINKITLTDDAGKSVKTPANAKKAVVDYTTIIHYKKDNVNEFDPRQLDISFQYQQITVDQNDGKVTQNPQIIVTQYKIKPKIKTN